MKKTYCLKLMTVLLAVSMLCTMLTGCESGGESSRTGPDVQSGEVTSATVEELSTGSEPLRVLVDVGICNTLLHSGGGGVRDKTLAELQEAIREKGGPADIEFELPFFDYKHASQNESDSIRDSELTRLRTEIMAGEGPDVFIVGCDNSGEHMREIPLFKYPEQIMKRRTFLPLDNYIENAQFMEWDKLTSIIMDAGKNDDGQQILPLTYTMPITVFRKSDFEQEPSKTMTFYDVVESSNPVSALFTDFVLDEKSRVVMDYDKMAGLFLEVVDYSTEQLAFSEEDLVGVIKTLGELDSKWNNNQIKDPIDHYYANLGVQFNRYYPDEEGKRIHCNIAENSTLTMEPLYSTQGGYCAFITSYAAINRNTKRPEDAFFLLDYLLSLECQQSAFYINMTVEQAIPTHEGAMLKRAKVCGGQDKEKNPVDGKMAWQKWCLSKANHEELSRLRDNISKVRFRTELDGKLVKLIENSRMLANSKEALQKEVHSTYIEMQMMLAES